MAPADKINLPFRWSFIPSQNAKDGAIRWSWRAYTQTGGLAMESQGTFDTFTDCMNDAKTHGYGQR
jgi:hypothetical protein